MKRVVLGTVPQIATAELSLPSLLVLCYAGAALCPRRFVRDDNAAVPVFQFHCKQLT